jgi:hypothetical protein
VPSAQHPAADPFDVFGPVPTGSDREAGRLLARALATPVGPHRQVLLSRVQGRLLSEADRVDFMTAWQECLSWVSAQGELSVALVAGPDPEPGQVPEPSSKPTGNVAEDARCATVSAALNVTPYAAIRRLTSARAAATELAPITSRVLAGEWTRLHLVYAGDAVAGHPRDLATRAVAAACAVSGCEVWTPARLKRRIKLELVRLDSEAVAKRIRARRHQRSARLDPAEDLHGTITVDGAWDTISWAFGQFRRWAEQERDRLREIRRRDPDARFCCPEAMAQLLAHATAETGECNDRSSRPTGHESPEDAGKGVGARGHGKGHRSGKGHQGAHGRGKSRGAGDAGQQGESGGECRFCGAPDSGVPSLSALTADAVVAAAGLLAAQLGDQSGDLAPARGKRWRYAAIMVDLPTLLGLAHEPGHVPGYGPVPAAIARELAADAAGWRRFLTDRTGVLLDAGAHTYRPGDRLREHVTVRDWTCTFPGCSRTAAEADLDHVENFDGTNTTAANLQPLCRTHHRVKTYTAWTPARRADGNTSWTSPTGHVYRSTLETPWHTGTSRGSRGTSGSGADSGSDSGSAGRLNVYWSPALRASRAEARLASLLVDHRTASARAP